MCDRTSQTNRNGTPTLSRIGRHNLPSSHPAGATIALYIGRKEEAK
jgi:hypothetical protein